MSQELIDRLIEDPVFFCVKILGFTPTFYQEDILRDSSKRVAIRCSRQSGKTFTMGAKAIWYAVTHPESLILVVSPSLRQSIIFRDKLGKHIRNIPRKLRRLMFEKILRTTIYFHNGSRIVALPCSVDKIRGYTADVVIVDESAMIPDDEYLFKNVLAPTLAVKDGYLYALSTPKNMNSYFYQICKGSLSRFWSPHHVTYRDAVKAGLYTEKFVEEQRAQCLPHEFMMEWEAEFVEDADSWLPYDLISQCIDPDLTYYGFEAKPRGRFYMGVDLGKHVDHSVVIVIEKKEEVDRVIHKKQFKLEMPYASVIGYIKTLCLRYRMVKGVLVDEGGNEYVVEDMVNSGIPNVEGIKFSQPRKEDILSYLKERMRTIDKNTKKRMLNIAYDSTLIGQMNIEKFEFSPKTKKLVFSHPAGSHDDQLWALALAVYAAREKKTGSFSAKTRRTTFKDFTEEDIIRLMY